MVVVNCWRCWKRYVHSTIHSGFFFGSLSSCVCEIVCVCSCVVKCALVRLINSMTNSSSNNNKINRLSNVLSWCERTNVCYSCTKSYYAVCTHLMLGCCCCCCMVQNWTQIFCHRRMRIWTLLIFFRIFLVSNLDFFCMLSMVHIVTNITFDNDQCEH